MQNLVSEIKTKCETLVKDLDANISGNKAAGRRARKSTVELSKLFKEYRQKSVEAEKN